MIFFNLLFVKKLKISCNFDHTILFKFHWHVVQTFSRNVWRDFALTMSALAAVAGKSFNGKFNEKIDFPIGYFYVTLADADIGSLKSLHTLFGKYLDYILVKSEQNRIVQTIQSFELFDKKWVTIFDKV